MRLGLRRRLPMKSGMTRKGVALALAALVGGGCFGSYERAIDETRSELIGLSGRDLRHCLGVPTDFDREDGIEYMTYRWVFKPRQPMGVHTSVGSGGVGGIVVGRQDAGGGYDPLGFPPDPSQMSTCQIVFELREDAVSKVTAHGESQSGLESDGKCLMRARRCTDVRADADE
jgi:hypothetical protein